MQIISFTKWYTFIEFRISVIERSKNTTLIARNLDRLEQTATTPNKTKLLSLDYQDSINLKKQLQTASKQNGKFDLAIIWIHGNAPQAPYIAAEFVKGDYYHVLSSSHADPSKDNSPRLAKFAGFADINYHEVILGFMTDAGYSRWLSHAEISAGVLAAISKKQKRFIVGTLTPWSARP